MPQSSHRTTSIVFKICARAAWAEACRTGYYDGSADDRRDGYIHLSAHHQVAGTAAKYFKHQHDLVIVSIATAPLGSALRWEPSRGGELFPHHYGPLPVASAVGVAPLPLDSDGVPIFPETLV